MYIPLTMSQDFPRILALDFDGIICDGLREYFATTKKAYLQIWSSNKERELEQWQSNFYRLRPVIETGWEMPILLRALVLGVSEDKILKDWHNICYSIIEQENLKSQEIAHQVDTVRDNWINSDLKGWLALHQFYDGVINRLKELLQSSIKLYIVTTKEGRFVRQLLGKEGISFPISSIVGKESKRPKYETLQQILDSYSFAPTQLWFVEDRLKTLQVVAQKSELEGIGLYLGDWGYNTEKMRQSIQNDSSINLLTLQQFKKDFSAWKE